MRISLYTCCLCLYIQIFSKGKENSRRKVLRISEEEYDVR